MKTIIAKLGLGLVTGLVATVCAAGNDAAQVSVSIVLNPPLQSGLCVSQTLSEQFGAVVRIVCATGQYVSITPAPGKQFPGAFGGAFRYPLFSGQYSPTLAFEAVGQSTQSPRNNTLRTGYNRFYPGSVSVTDLPVYRVEGLNSQLDMLVTF
jgi:hypothetical protein